MRFLITGITGFNGPHLAKILIEQGHTVYGLYRDSSVLDINDVLKQYRDKLILLKGDLLRSLDVDTMLSTYKFDGIFHLGAFTHPPTSFDNPILALQTNTLATAIIVEAIRKYQSNCVLMQCSTSEVYGVQKSGISIDESFPMNPMNPYAVSKACADLFVLERTRNNMINAFITRAFSHTGERRRSNYAISSDAIQIAKIIKGKQEPIINVGNLSSIRSVIDVEEVVSVYYKLMLKMLDGSINNGEIFIVGGGKPYTIGEMLQMMLDMFDVDAETKIDPKLYRKIDIPCLIPDSTKIRKLLNWTPSIPLEVTLKKLVNYWLEKV